MSSEKKPPSDTDAALFREAMKPVRPLQLDNNRIEPTQRRPSFRHHQTKQNHKQLSRGLISTSMEYSEIKAEDELLFSRSGIQHSVLRKLRRGQYSNSTELDLHGMTVSTAHQTLTEFLHHCQDSGISRARIIHGKGYGSTHQKPVLKNMVNLWLQQHDEVLAFCSARPGDGGTGAVYILVKQN